MAVNFLLRLLLSISKKCAINSIDNLIKSKNNLNIQPKLLLFNLKKQNQTFIIYPGK